MKRLATLPFILAIAACSHASGPPRVADSVDATNACRVPPPADVRSAAQSNNAFGVSLYQQLSKAEENLVISPGSLGIALNMLRAGAGGETKRQLESALRVQLPDERTHAALGGLSICYGDTEGRPYELVLANRIFAETHRPVQEPFLGAMSRYGATAEIVDFGATEAARVYINDWVKDTTKQHIKDLLPGGSITPLTSMVLTNAIYFKGHWQQEFKKADTQPGRFDAPGGPREVPTMSSEGRHRFLQTEKAQLVELAYTGDRFAMDLLIPAEVNGLAALVSNLDAKELERWLDEAEPHELQLALPRFKLGAAKSVTLKKPLQAMGIVDAFEDGKADLDGLFGGGDWVSDVYHQSFVEVNEEGTVAAAATGVVVTTEAPSGKLHVRADRPFLFLIRDVHTGFILFMGQVADPS